MVVEKAHGHDRVGNRGCAGLGPGGLHGVPRSSTSTTRVVGPAPMVPTCCHYCRQQCRCCCGGFRDGSDRQEGRNEDTSGNFSYLSRGDDCLGYSTIRANQLRRRGETLRLGCIGDAHSVRQLHSVHLDCLFGWHLDQRGFSVVDPKSGREISQAQAAVMASPAARTSWRNRHRRRRPTLGRRMSRRRLNRWMWP